jgi:hypothetical protein
MVQRWYYSTHTLYSVLYIGKCVSEYYLILLGRFSAKSDTNKREKKKVGVSEHHNSAK